MRSFAVTRGLALVAASFCTAAALIACSPDSGSSPSESPTAEAPRASVSPEPTEPAVAATGQLIETEALSYRLPTPLWEAKSKSGTSAGFIDTTNSGIWLLTEDESEVLIPEHRDLDNLARYAGVGDPSFFDPPLERGEDRVVAGVEGFTATTVRINESERSLDTRYYVWGGAHGDHSVYLELSGLASDPRTEEWFDAVLASVTWK